VSTRISVVLDVDDTLYLERDYVRSGFSVVGSWLLQWREVENFSELCWEKFENGARGNIFNSVLEDLNVPASPGLVNALVELYRAHDPDILLLPDAREAIAAVKDIATVSIITDGPALSQSQKVRALGLQKVGGPVVLTEVLGEEFRKPSRRAFEYVQKIVNGARCVYVADNPRKDFVGPKELGWFTVRVRREGGLHFRQPSDELVDCEVSTLQRLRTIIDDL
jgi:putative hydrolase of the HAD superfamily